MNYKNIEKKDYKSSFEVSLDPKSIQELVEKKITEKNFFSFLDAPVEEIDFMIRTGGDKRISNFLLYHLAYSELLFVDTLWPDFSQKEYSKCLNHFMKVERRFGKRI